MHPRSSVYGLQWEARSRYIEEIEKPPLAPVNRPQDKELPGESKDHGLRMSNHIDGFCSSNSKHFPYGLSARLFCIV